MRNMNHNYSIFLHSTLDDKNNPQKPFIDVMECDGAWCVSLCVMREYGIVDHLVRMFIYDRAQLDYLLNSLSQALAKARITQEYAHQA